VAVSPDGKLLATIGPNAFQRCLSLGPTITLPTGLVAIDQRAFADGAGLVDVTLPAGLATLENGLFKSFDRIVSGQLDPIWHTVSKRLKQFVFDLRTLRQLTEYLLRYDAVTFLRYIRCCARTRRACTRSGCARTRPVRCSRRPSGACTPSDKPSRR
jgi:hypothetical protein